MQKELPTQAASMKPSPDTPPASPGTIDIPEQIKKREVARGVGLDEEEGWSKFMALNGTAWVGKPVVRSEERGYTAVLLGWVDGE